MYAGLLSEGNKCQMRLTCGRKWSISSQNNYCNPPLYFVVMHAYLHLQCPGWWSVNHVDACAVESLLQSVRRGESTLPRQHTCRRRVTISAPRLSTIACQCSISHRLWMRGVTHVVSDISQCLQLHFNSLKACTDHRTNQDR